MDTYQQIIEASLAVFVENGYLQSSTIEIAKKAGVAEVTLFRKFGSKKNLFEQAMLFAIDTAFVKSINLGSSEDVETFLYNLLYDRMILISKERATIKMLISESLAGHLEDDMNFLKKTYSLIYNSIEQFKQMSNKDVNTKVITSLITGILLDHVLLFDQLDFVSLTKSEQEIYIKDILNHISL